MLFQIRLLKREKRGVLDRYSRGKPSICMHIGYVPRERPTFSALNFRSGAYHFHKLPKKSVPEHHHFTLFGGFCRSGDHHFQNFFNFNLFIASHGRLSPNAKRSAAPRVSGRSGDSHFHAQPFQLLLMCMSLYITKSLPARFKCVS